MRLTSLKANTLIYKSSRVGFWKQLHKTAVR